MLCSERHVLLSGYRDTTRAYADSVGKMTDLAGFRIDSEVDLLRRACKTTWEKSERARLALARHEANHGCDRTDFAAAAVPGGGQPETSL